MGRPKKQGRPPTPEPKRLTPGRPPHSEPEIKEKVDLEAFLKSKVRKDLGLVDGSEFVEYLHKLPPRAQRFLRCFALRGNFTQAARDSGVSTYYHSRWLAKSQRYQRAFEMAKGAYADLLESVAHSRAVNGVAVLKFHPHTGEPYVEYRYSDQLLLALLKAKKPEEFQSISTQIQKISGKHELEITTNMPGMVDTTKLPIEIQRYLLAVAKWEASGSDETNKPLPPKQIQQLLPDEPSGSAPHPP